MKPSKSSMKIIDRDSATWQHKAPLWLKIAVAYINKRNTLLQYERWSLFIAIALSVFFFSLPDNGQLGVLLFAFNAYLSLKARIWLDENQCFTDIRETSCE